MSKEDKYIIIQPQDEEGFNLSSEENKSRHLVARNGDHLMIPFQYELYHFRNLKAADPRRGSEDILLLRTIRRENVDVFCSRKSRTVEATLKEIRKIEVIGK